MPSYYDILGVSNNAKDDEIKKKYRQLSLMYHPDRNKGSNDATKKFQEISEAYEILGDPNKRKQYDLEMRLTSTMPPFFSNGGSGVGDPILEMFLNGMAANKRGGPGPDIASGIFSTLFGMGGPGDMEGPGIHIFHAPPPEMFQRMNSVEKPSPTYITVVLTLQQAYLGVSYPVEINRWVGNPKNTEKEVVYVTIPPGIDDKEMIELLGKGDVVNSSIKGDVKIIIEIKNDTNFYRSGLDLHYCKKLTLKEALCGFTFEMEHLNGKRICFNNTVNTTIIQPNHKKVVNNMGMIRGDARGNLVIEFEVEFPKELSEEKMKAIRDILDE